MKRIISFFVVLLLVFSPLVHAEEEPTTTTTTASNKCSYSTKYELRKEADNIKIVYDIKKDDNGTEYVEIVVYNLTEKIYLSYDITEVVPKGSSGSNSRDNELITYYRLNEDGTYVFKDYDNTKIKNYKFNVGDASGLCGNRLKTITITKPKYNEYSDLDECKYFDSENYTYCKKWISKNFTDSPYSIVEKIKKQREQVNKMNSTECLSCAEIEKDNALYERILLIRRLVIIGLIIGIIVDIVVIILLAKRVKESRVI